MRLLWYPKKWKKTLSDPSQILATSNRIRVYNNHEVVKSFPGVVSEIAGLTDKNPNPASYDVVIFQKSLNRRLAALLRQSGVTVIWDVCDTFQVPTGLSYCVDAMIVSNHSQAAFLQRQAAHVPVHVVEDAYEADSTKEKGHTQKTPIRVTSYGTFASISSGLRPLQPVLDQLQGVEFEFADGRFVADPANPAYRTDVIFHLDWREAASRPDSWQSFIFSSDVGIVPIPDLMKSSNRILNYMAYGIPVVCSPIDSYKRVIRHGENGFFAESPDDWADALEKLKDPALRARFGQAARKAVLEKYSIPTIAKQYLSVLQELHSTKKHRTLPGLRSITRLVVRRWAQKEASCA